MSGVNRGQSRNAPPLELMHLAAAGNTVVGDKYGLFFSYFLFSSFFLGQGRGGSECKGESCSNASMRWCLGLFSPPMLNPLCIVNMATASVSEARLLALLLPCQFVLTSSGLTGPGPALRQTSTCVCTVLGM